ncbi:MAG: glutathione-regulated potassium-efflux system protein KefC [Deltaproteobacteria bacterium]|nr:glutathione-regulated potassium-efflux system protein KefC [Deltaproteobacteria bacterium]
MSAGVLQSALIFLAAAVITVPIFQRIGLGSVLGYLISGIAIGPWGLGLISNVDDILHFSEFGVVLFLFLIGLELEPKRLWSLRVPIFGLGSAQVAANTAIFTLIGWLLGFAWPVAFLAGMGFSLSSTAIALQVMKERGNLQTHAGNSAFSTLLFQDIAVIPMIAIVPLLALAPALGAGEPAGSKLVSVVKVIGVLAGTIFFGRFAVRPILRAVASAKLREIFTAFALFLVVGMSALMQQIELSMGLGAFLAGVLLADSEYRHALETDIEPFKGLLLGLFFMSVGMSIDVGSVRESPLMIFGIVMGVIALKFAIHFALGALFKIANPSRYFFSLVLAQVGEFAFVLFAAGKAAGVLGDNVMGPLIAATALSMLASPILLAGYGKWIEPRFSIGQKPDADSIENSHPEVIIAGFGRFGQIVGRLLYANGTTATVLDHEPDQIELLRKFGFKVYYGDATREDLLHAAGAAEAKVLVVAIDSIDESLKLVDLAKSKFPHLKILARARNVQHMYGLIERKVKIIERETFESSLRLGRHVLAELGVSAHESWQATNRFRDHNVQMIQDMSKFRNNQADLVARAKQAREDLEKMFERERLRREVAQSGWGD